MHDAVPTYAVSLRALLYGLPDMAGSSRIIAGAGEREVRAFSVTASAAPTAVRPHSKSQRQRPARAIKCSRSFPNAACDGRPQRYDFSPDFARRVAGFVRIPGQLVAEFVRIPGPVPCLVPVESRHGFRYNN